MPYPTYPSTTFSSMARPSNASLNLALPPSRLAQQMLRGGMQPGGQAALGLSPEEQQAAFNLAHPFAPTGSFTPTLPPRYGAPVAPDANAGTYAPGSPPVYDESRYNAVDGFGRPVAAPPRSTATLYQGWKNVTPGGERQYDLTGRGAQDPVLSAAGGPSPEAMAYQRLFPSAGAPPSPMSTPGVNGNLVSLAGSAASLQDSQAAVAADRTLKLLDRAGALPSASDSPESSANKFGYLNSRLQTSLNGGTPRAPGSPVMDAADPVLPARYAAPAQVTTGYAANLYRSLQTSSLQPGFIEDPVSGERKLLYNGHLESSGTNPAMKQVQPGASEQDLRKEYTALPEAHAFRQVSAAYNKITNLPENSKFSAADDMALIYGYMKILDPGSTVREGEYASAEQARGIPADIVARYNSMLKGERLAPEQRENFRKSAEGQYSGQLSTLAPRIRQFRDVAARNKYELGSIIPDDDLKALDAFEKGNSARNNPQTGAGQFVVGQRRRQNGVTYQYNGRGWVGVK